MLIHSLFRKGLDADEHLNSRQKADRKVYDALLFSWYVDSKNFTEEIRPLYAKLLAFPIRYFTPTQLRDAAKARLERYGVVTVGDLGVLLDKDKKMDRVALESYDVLLKKIGNNEYFFGDQPSTLDVIVYSHLSLHLYAKLPHPNLSIILNNEYPRLARFCNRMKNRLSSQPINQLPDIDLPSVFTGLIKSPRTWFTSSEVKTSKTEETPQKSEAQIKFERKRNISIFGAIVLMIVHVVWNGIITIEWDDKRISIL
ncbi:8284_t:CDS:2 [Diversispora eburnea]|uniref:8284_t:CDS:1 n=2 Tax=Diversisporales TaxID=214509 RepID=A0A9N9BNY0_9GLOM|nr:8284_t:CDS:2 [Diversispora eburnea]